MIYTIVAVEGMEKVESKTKEAEYDSKVDDDAILAAKYGEKRLQRFES